MLPSITRCGFVRVSQLPTRGILTPAEDDEMGRQWDSGGMSDPEFELVLAVRAATDMELDEDLTERRVEGLPTADVTLWRETGERVPVLVAARLNRLLEEPLLDESWVMW